MSNEDDQVTLETLTRRAELDALLEEASAIAVIWNIENVLSIRADLTRDQAWQVLQEAKRNHDANIGINWEYLSVIAESHFPTPSIKSIAEDKSAD